MLQLNTYRSDPPQRQTVNEIPPQDDDEYTAIRRSMGLIDDDDDDEPDGPYTGSVDSEVALYFADGSFKPGSMTVLEWWQVMPHFFRPRVNHIDTATGKSYTISNHLCNGDGLSCDPSFSRPLRAGFLLRQRNNDPSTKPIGM